MKFKVTVLKVTLSRIKIPVIANCNIKYPFESQDLIDCDHKPHVHIYYFDQNQFLHVILFWSWYMNIPIKNGKLVIQTSGANYGRY